MLAGRFPQAYRHQDLAHPELAVALARVVSGSPLGRTSRMARVARVRAPWRLAWELSRSPSPTNLRRSAPSTTAPNRPGWTVPLASTNVRDGGDGNPLAPGEVGHGQGGSSVVDDAFLGDEAGGEDGLWPRKGAPLMTNTPLRTVSEPSAGASTGDLPITKAGCAA